MIRMFIIFSTQIRIQQLQLLFPNSSFELPRLILYNSCHIYMLALNNKKSLFVKSVYRYLLNIESKYYVYFYTHSEKYVRSVSCRYATVLRLFWKYKIPFHGSKKLKA